MSEILSTLIAFVGFLIVLSMLVQSLQEALKNLFKLKTGVYERFFIDLYKEEFFKPVKGLETPKEVNQKPAKEPKREAENEQVKHTFFSKIFRNLKQIYLKLFKGEEQVKHSSFWKIFRSGEFVGEFDKRMGRLKKVVDQAGEIFGETKDALRTIAELNPSSSDYAQKIAASVQLVTNSLAKITALRLDLVLNIYDKFNGGKINQFYKKVSDFKEKYALPLEDIAEEELQKCPERAKQLLMVLDKVKRMISDYRLQIEERMDAWLAQLNEVYRKNMLKWTVALGAVIVIFFNADAFNIYQYLSTHDAARAVISQQVEGVVVPAQKAKAEDLNRITALTEQNKAKEAKDLISTLSTNLAEDLEAYKKEDKAKLARAVKKEAETIKVDPPTQQAMESLRAKTGELAVLYVNLQKTSFDRQLDALTSLDLPLGWVEDWKKYEENWKKYKEKTGSRLAVLSCRKIGGLILTIFLITFGAPFWNDILSALTGIKNRAVKEGKSGEPEGIS